MTASRRRMSLSPRGMNLQTIPRANRGRTSSSLQHYWQDAWRSWKRGERVHTLPARGSIPQQETLVVATVETGAIGSSPVAGAIALIAAEGHVVGGHVRAGPVKLTLGQLRRIRRRRLAVTPAVRPCGPQID